MYAPSTNAHRGGSGGRLVRPVVGLGLVAGLSLALHGADKHGSRDLKDAELGLVAGLVAGLGFKVAGLVAGLGFKVAGLVAGLTVRGCRAESSEDW